MSTEYFTVDAALLQELGERLIGAPHIALAELVKNSYDADANTCRITFGKDSIEVIDDGHGMSLEEFRSFWLKLGTQHKRQEEHSPNGRLFAGSKGVGRLAAQFLAAELELWTTAERRGALTYKARVDWSQIQAGKTLRQVPVTLTRVPASRKPKYPNRRTHGTRILLKKLWEKDWNELLVGLGDELWSLRSPFSALRNQKSVRKDPFWFDVELRAPGMKDAEAEFNRKLRALTQDVWQAKISGRVAKGRSSDEASISIEFKSDYPKEAFAGSYSDVVKLSELGLSNPPKAYGKALLDEATFTIFVYKLEGRQPGGMKVDDLRDYLQAFGNVSIYDTGFRLPYYGMDNDWLDVSQDQARRLAKSNLLDARWNLQQTSPYMEDLPAPRRLFGAVEINTNTEASRKRGAQPGEWLQIQSSRDRLHPNNAYLQLQSLVRYALHLYANRYRARLLKVREDKRDTEPASRKYSRVRKLIEDNRHHLPEEVYQELVREVGDAQKAAKAAEDLFDARTLVLAPLASAGMTALGLTHELARETHSLEHLRRRLTKLGEQHGLPDVVGATQDLGASLLRLRTMQNLFAPLLTEADRTGSSRLRIDPIVRQVVDALKPLTPGLMVEVDVPENLRFPPAPLASWNAVLQNILANSWNAILDAREAKVRIEAHAKDGEEWVWISDTGVGLGVDLAQAPRFFDALERKLEINPDRRSIAIGGTGMGLAIVRILCDQHDVSVQFVEPRPGYSTTIELWWEE